MSKHLVIVESPAKAGTIGKYLGSDYIVKSSIGHIRDLPKGGTAVPEGKKSGTNALVRRMGIDPDKNWEATYAVIDGKQQVVSELRRLAKNCKSVYLATDKDREGEAISWHLKELLADSNNDFKRVTFNEITKKAILESFSKPTTIDMNMVNAQQARRFLDRVVGFMVSPLLWSKVGRGLSAGRVQSVALELVCEREKEIRSHIPVEYWDIDILTKSGHVSFKMGIHGTEVKDEQQARIIDKAIRQDNGNFLVKSVETKETGSRPSAPFVTSTLQQSASNRLGFGVKRTMGAAQKLYEKGYITYMRTDSTFISADALGALRAFIPATFDSRYLPEKPNFYGNKANAQEAHEAIRPTDVRKMPVSSGLQSDELKLYELIWCRYVASQMTAARYNSTTIHATCGGYGFTAKGKTVLFDGYTKVLSSDKSDEIDLPTVHQGQRLPVNDVKLVQHFTKPVSRFNEASLVKELEKRGIGRPSTYASIISTIQDRGYIRIDNRRIFAEKIGEIVTDRLKGSFKDLMSYDFTASFENKLDQIAEGKVSWQSVLDDFYLGFKGDLESANINMPNNKAVVVEGLACPQCQGMMHIRTAGTGMFFGCVNYSKPPKERCKGTISITAMDKSGIQVDDDESMKKLREKERCTICQSTMSPYVSGQGRKILICDNNPECSGHRWDGTADLIDPYDGPEHPCDTCNQGNLRLKQGRFGPYYACTNCDETRKLLKDGSPATTKMKAIPMKDFITQCGKDHFMLREGENGLYLGASKFPKVRDIRSITVAELKEVIEQIPERLRFLTTGPDQAQVKWDRSVKEYYLSSPGTFEEFVYRDGQWVIHTRSRQQSTKPKKGKKK